MPPIASRYTVPDEAPSVLTEASLPDPAIPQARLLHATIVALPSRSHGMHHILTVKTTGLDEVPVLPPLNNARSNVAKFNSSVLGALSTRGRTCSIHLKRYYQEIKVTGAEEKIGIPLMHLLQTQKLIKARHF